MKKTSNTGEIFVFVNYMIKPLGNKILVFKNYIKLFKKI